MRERAARCGRLIGDSVGSMVATAGTRDAAQVAYYLVMSFPAILLLLVWGFSTLLNDDSVREPIVDAIVQAVPLADPSERRQVEQLLDDVAAGAGGLGWLGVVALLYSASGAIGATRHAVNDAWGERDPRPFVPGKALDVSLTLVVGPVVLIALGLTLSGELASAIGDHPGLAAVAQFVVTRILPLVLLFAVVAGLFVVLPGSPRATLRTAWPGALVAVVGVVAIQFGAEAYFSVVGNANAIYGTMGLLLAVVFSAYLAAVVVIFGAHVSAQAGKPADEAERPAQPLGRFILESVRGLFVRPDRRRA
jgi:membrane protein